MKNIRIFYLIFFPFFGGKFSLYLNRHVFVMSCTLSILINYKMKMGKFLGLTKV